jgi:23S rRNA (cytidine1920-2'-O)/16S rRNA (cytidine1409-2'-O)-methyltransferase
VGKGEVGKGGIVRDEAKRRAALDGVVAFAEEIGLAPLGSIDSPIEGAEGNREFLVALRVGG